jgi:hypothetical protein
MTSHKFLNTYFYFLEYKMMKLKVIVFALALFTFSAQSVSARSQHEIDSDRFLANDPKPDIDQPLLIRKTRSASCDQGCNSDGDCSGSNTCNKCCWWLGYGNICTDPNNLHLGICASPNFVGVVTDWIFNRENPQNSESSIVAT